MDHCENSIETTEGGTTISFMVIPHDYYNIKNDNDGDVNQSMTDDFYYSRNSDQYGTSRTTEWNYKGNARNKQKLISSLSCFFIMASAASIISRAAITESLSPITLVDGFQYQYRRNRLRTKQNLSSNRSPTFNDLSGENRLRSSRKTYFEPELRTFVSCSISTSALWKKSPFLLKLLSGKIGRAVQSDIIKKFW